MEYSVNRLQKLSEGKGETKKDLARENLAKKMRALVHGLSITNDILRPGNEKNIWKRTSI